MPARTSRTRRTAPTARTSSTSSTASTAKTSATSRTAATSRTTPGLLGGALLERKVEVSTLSLEVSDNLIGEAAPEVAVVNIAPVSGSSPRTGDAVLALARKHVGERYDLGARAPMSNANWKGPWDCAEFASWCVYQTSGILYGVRPRSNPILADAYTGYWVEQAEADGAVVPIEVAARTPGALLVRAPRSSRIGHIVISDGDGGTVEAHDTKRGVITHTLRGRMWDIGVCVPGITYLQSDIPVPIELPTDVIRITAPLTRGPTVKEIQQVLTQLGFDPGSVDGIYGPQTAFAVQMFQRDHGLVPDGEVGSLTLKRLRDALQDMHNG